MRLRLVLVFPLLILILFSFIMLNSRNKTDCSHSLCIQQTYLGNLVRFANAAPEGNFTNSEQPEGRSEKPPADFTPGESDENLKQANPDYVPESEAKAQQAPPPDYTPGQSGGSSNPGGNTGGTTKSGCLIATAAFGSELSPQVQFLRNFRDNRILSTVSGSSFMNVFNSVYYSFSPSVADYERGQPWLRVMVRIAIYPLLDILQVSEKSYSLIPNEYGSLVSGLTASSLIGLVYFTPIALCERRLRTNRKSDFKAFVIIIATVTLTLLITLLINNKAALMVTTSLFVVTLCGISSILGARMTTTLIGRLKTLLETPKPSY
jgi:uncharacterized membrane protein YhaH (DUF805 family)